MKVIVCSCYFSMLLLWLGSISVARCCNILSTCTKDVLKYIAQMDLTQQIGPLLSILLRPKLPFLTR